MKFLRIIFVLYGLLCIGNLNNLQAQEPELADPAMPGPLITILDGYATQARIGGLVLVYNAGGRATYDARDTLYVFYHDGNGWIEPVTYYPNGKIDLGCECPCTPKPPLPSLRLDSGKNLFFQDLYDEKCKGIPRKRINVWYPLLLRWNITDVDDKLLVSSVVFTGYGEGVMTIQTRYDPWIDLRKTMGTTCITYGNLEVDLLEK